MGTMRIHRKDNHQMHFMQITIMKQFISRNRVLFAGIVSAVTLVLQQCARSGQTSFKVLSFAVLITVIGVIANQWRGKGVTILGIVATLCTVFQTIWSTGRFTWNEFLLNAAIAVLAMFSGGLNAGKQEQPTLVTNATLNQVAK
jgi:hypothetical protein